MSLDSTKDSFTMHDSFSSPEKENKIIKEAVDKLKKQFKAHPEKIEMTKGVMNLFSILKNLINGSLISAKMDQNLADDYTVEAMIFMVKNKIFEIPSLELAIKNGMISDYKSFKVFYEFVFLDSATKTPSSGVNTT